MPDLTLAERLVETLPHGVAGLFNPWRDVCQEDTPFNSPEERIKRLAAHLDCKPRFLVVGEASGYQGMRRSAIAFTSERQLLEGAIPRIARLDNRLTTRRLPFSEPSATIVWKALYRLHIAEHTILWNALPMHPHKPGDIQSNRTPTNVELQLGVPAMRLLVEAFPRAKVIAVGKKAEGLLQAMGVATAGAVRHPANGGATAFAEGMAALAASS
ncbi:hypothetical protein F6X40_11005 [Paraburkholderia sp. UCT31]|uniref:uracil-DNA glycosylase n=1 Tax=Paraburkholderia sp. UCT31 TaxID=2615209 RepID=UPI0016558053|nr:uracil-DNA glycosylase [Paraburkholderia sp. UCT31]MBC8737331.1 hypothetical protein [Paraburkholderia sp. UCT31]